MKRRTFIRNVALGGVLFSGLRGAANSPAEASGKTTRATLKDRFWLLGENAGSHHIGSPEGGYKLPGKNLMESREGCEFFGIDRCVRCAMSTGPFPPFDKEAEKLKGLKEVVWSAIGAGGVKLRYDNDQSDLDEVLRIAALYPNISGAFLDDFFKGAQYAGKRESSIGRHSLKSIQNMRDRLHGFNGRRLDLWVVWYEYQLEFKIRPYLDLCDVITFWTWKGSRLPDLDSNLKQVVNNTPGKRHLVGCYMWNYGERKPLTMDQMKYQLDRYYHWLTRGAIEGIVFCSNCIADIGLDTVDYTRRWIAEVGHETWG